MPTMFRASLPWCYAIQSYHDLQWSSQQCYPQNHTCLKRPGALQSNYPHNLSMHSNFVWSFWHKTQACVHRENSDSALQYHLASECLSMVHKLLVAYQQVVMDQEQCVFSRMDTNPGTVWGISEECEVCGIRQPRRTVDLCCDAWNGFLRSLLHIGCFECLVMFLLVVETDQLDTLCLFVIYHLFLDTPKNKRKTVNTWNTWLWTSVR